ncbi:hypothetical protein [Methylobacterium sp. ID0610]|uniref:hypothetical protein n=1 Tax=Methylobacterium carpenticola TaxID=3344827 RepID=UPI0036985171
MSGQARLALGGGAASLAVKPASAQAFPISYSRKLVPEIFANLVLPPRYTPHPVIGSEVYAEPPEPAALRRDRRSRWSSGPVGATRVASGSTSSGPNSGTSSAPSSTTPSA